MTNPLQTLYLLLMYCWEFESAKLTFLWLSDKESTCQCRRPGFDPWMGKIPWRSKWQPIPVLLPGEAPRTEEPGRLQSMGLQRIGHD